MSKKVYNINSMRPVIITAHSADYCNSKAITKEMVVGVGVGLDHFNVWKTNVNALRETVCDYIRLKHDTSAEDSVVYAARERIFPKWKAILEAGETDKTTRELHVTPYDVDSLVGFAETFMGTSRGTVITYTTQQIFRKNVEALLGCRIAQNAVMSDKDRDVLKEYYSIQNAISGNIEKLAEIKSSRNQWELMKPEAKNEPTFLKFINNKLHELEEEEKALMERRQDLDTRLIKVSPKAKQIEMLLKTIK